MFPLLFSITSCRVWFWRLYDPNYEHDKSVMPLFIINVASDEGSTCGRTIWHWFQKFSSEDTNLEFQVDRDVYPQLRTIIKKHLLYKTYVKFSKKMTVSVTISRISDYLKKIGNVMKLNKWIPCKLSENQRAQILKCVRYFFCGTLMIHFLIKKSDF